MKHDKKVPEKEKGGSDDEPVEKELPNFEPSGLLLRESNLRNGVVVQYSQPPDARIPSKKWLLYMFKGESNEEPRKYSIYKQAAYMFGKDQRVADIPLLHPTISKQHAVIQFRQLHSEVV
eukprot:GHVU01050040.1.p1 GENE.GHVU01050040.1~~GHVU01050040.1.p1  ORF type:complete len:120 (+),score=18.69 GHVU01050040.1:236-595(+)